MFVVSCLAAGIILDLSHAGHITARDILEYIERKRLLIPIVASHSGYHGAYAYPRNLPWDVIRGIAERGGLVDVPTLTFILDEEKNDLSLFFYHLNYAIKNGCLFPYGKKSSAKIFISFLRGTCRRAKLNFLVFE